MKVKKCIIFFLVISLCSVYADSVTELFKKAINSYEENKLIETISLVEKLSKQLKIEELEKEKERLSQLDENKLHQYKEITFDEWIKFNKQYNGGYKITNVKINSLNEYYDEDTLILYFGDERLVIKKTIDGYDALKYSIDFFYKYDLYKTNYIIYIWKSSEEDISIKRIEGPSISEVDARVKEYISNLENKGKLISEGYVYHGIEELNENTLLFKNDALENGHAYMVEPFFLEHRTYAKYLNLSTSIYISFLNIKVKQEFIKNELNNKYIIVAMDYDLDDSPIVIGSLTSD